MKLISADANPTQTHSLPPSHSPGTTGMLLLQLSQLLVGSSWKLWDCPEPANNWEVLGRVTYGCECACKEVAMSPCEVCIWTEKLYVLHCFRRIGITEDSGNQSRKREIQIKTRWLLHSVKLAQEGVNYTLSCTTEASWAVSSHLSSGNTGGDSTSVPSWIYFQGSFTFHQQLSEWFTSGGHYGKVKNKHAPSQFPGTPPLSGLLFIYLAYLLSYTFPLQHSSTTDWIRDCLSLTGFLLHWFEVYCAAELAFQESQKASFQWMRMQ